MFNPRERSQPITFFAFLLVTCFLCGIASATPSITLSKKSGPPTSGILVSGRGFEPNVGVDIFFDTKDEALVITNGKGGFDNAKAYDRQRSRQPPDGCSVRRGNLDQALSDRNKLRKSEGGHFE
jgi:hypothetical protein